MQKTISLNPGETKEITFTYKPTSPKTYQVFVDGLSGTFVVLPSGIGKYVVSISAPAQVDIGESFTIEVNITNVGASAECVYQIITSEMILVDSKLVPWERVLKQGKYYIGAGQTLPISTSVYYSDLGIRTLIATANGTRAETMVIVS